MSDSTETVSEAPAAPARKARGPRGAFTVGDLRTAQRFGALEAAIEANKGNPEFDKALRQLASEPGSAAAALAGLGEGERIMDKRVGAFVSLKALGGTQGGKCKIEKVGETMVVSLA